MDDCGYLVQLSTRSGCTDNRAGKKQAQRGSEYAGAGEGSEYAAMPYRISPRKGRRSEDGVAGIAAREP